MENQILYRVDSKTSIYKLLVICKIVFNFHHNHLFICTPSLYLSPLFHNWRLRGRNGYFLPQSLEWVDMSYIVKHTQCPLFPTSIPHSLPPSTFLPLPPPSLPPFILTRGNPTYPPSWMVGCWSLYTLVLANQKPGLSHLTGRCRSVASY